MAAHRKLRRARLIQIRDTYRLITRENTVRVRRPAVGDLLGWLKPRLLRWYLELTDLLVTCVSIGKLMASKQRPRVVATESGLVFRLHGVQHCKGNGMELSEMPAYGAFAGVSILWRL